MWNRVTADFADNYLPKIGDQEEQHGENFRVNLVKWQRKRRKRNLFVQSIKLFGFWGKRVCRSIEAIRWANANLTLHTPLGCTRSDNSRIFKSPDSMLSTEHPRSLSFLFLISRMFTHLWILWLPSLVHRLPSIWWTKLKIQRFPSSNTQPITEPQVKVE